MNEMDRQRAEGMIEELSNKGGKEVSYGKDYDEFKATMRCLEACNLRLEQPPSPQMWRHLAQPEHLLTLALGGPEARLKERLATVLGAPVGHFNTTEDEERVKEALQAWGEGGKAPLVAGGASHEAALAAIGKAIEADAISTRLSIIFAGSGRVRGDLAEMGKCLDALKDLMGLGPEDVAKFGVQEESEAEDAKTADFFSPVTKFEPDGTPEVMSMVEGVAKGLLTAKNPLHSPLGVDAHTLKVGSYALIDLLGKKKAKRVLREASYQWKLQAGRIPFLRKWRIIQTMGESELHNADVIRKLHFGSDEPEMWPKYIDSYHSKVFFGGYRSRFLCDGRFEGTLYSSPSVCLMTNKLADVRAHAFIAFSSLPQFNSLTLVPPTVWGWYTHYDECICGVAEDTKEQPMADPVRVLQGPPYPHPCPQEPDRDLGHPAGFAGTNFLPPAPYKYAKQAGVPRNSLVSHPNVSQSMGHALYHQFEFHWFGMCDICWELDESNYEGCDYEWFPGRDRMVLLFQVLPSLAYSYAHRVRPVCIHLRLQACVKLEPKLAEAERKAIITLLMKQSDLPDYIAWLGVQASREDQAKPPPQGLEGKEVKYHSNCDAVLWVDYQECRKQMVLLLQGLFDSLQQKVEEGKSFIKGRSLDKLWTSFAETVLLQRLDLVVGRERVLGTIAEMVVRMVEKDPGSLWEGAEDAARAIFKIAGDKSDDFEGVARLREMFEDEDSSDEEEESEDDDDEEDEEEEEPPRKRQRTASKAKPKPKPKAKGKGKQPPKAKAKPPPKAKAKAKPKAKSKPKAKAKSKAKPKAKAKRGSRK